jgi:BirA family transcriptional regulator, biotin operon repressor / biotin---[acetyl-CoA-carboxylase] ligase
MQSISRAAQVLRLLLEAPGPRSGEAMGESLGCSRAAVGKAVSALRQQGFDIQARSNQGYTLASEPKDLLATRVEARLEPESLGIPFLHFKELDSTNLEARRQAEAGAPHGACLAAEHQSAGRGRLDRRWLAPKGTCLLFSLILRPQLRLDQVFGLTSLAALAVCRAVEALSDLKPLIKWPNDVFLNGKKLAGILTEFTSRAENLEFVVVGVGLNVNLTLKQLAKLPAPAESLKAATGSPWDRATLLAKILAEANQIYSQAKPEALPNITDEYTARSLLADCQVTVQDGDEVRSGVARGIDESGALLLEESPGQIRVIRHGDVSVLSRN